MLLWQSPSLGQGTKTWSWSMIPFWWRKLGIIAYVWTKIIIRWELCFPLRHRKQVKPQFRAKEEVFVNGGCHWLYLAGYWNILRCIMKEKKEAEKARWIYSLELLVVLMTIEFHCLASNLEGDVSGFLNLYVLAFATTKKITGKILTILQRF